MRSRPCSSASSSRSRTTTSRPDVATTCAIAWPMRPAPTTPTLRISLLTGAESNECQTRAGEQECGVLELRHPARPLRHARVVLPRARQALARARGGRDLHRERALRQVPQVDRGPQALAPDDLHQLAVHADRRLDDLDVVELADADPEVPAAHALSRG